MLHITLAEAKNYLLGQMGLRSFRREKGTQGLIPLLNERRCIQLDPLNAIGTNADLVAIARIQGLKQGDVYRGLFPEHALEHYAKERCLLPASAFPYYREQALKTPNWRLTNALKQVPSEILDSVLQEIQEKGPVSAKELASQGNRDVPKNAVWNRTSRLSTMALEVLWARCQIVICQRETTTKKYDIPSRALPLVHSKNPEMSFERWALLERIEACGFLDRSLGPWWSMLEQTRKSTLIAQLLREKKILEVLIQGSSKVFLAPFGFLDRSFPADDGHLRIIAPLDPLIWNRKLVQHLFGFEYVWEVYKPAHKRKWGWYVCPLLHQGQLVGRLEGENRNKELQVKNLWMEENQTLPKKEWNQTLQRHSQTLS